MRKLLLSLLLAATLATTAQDDKPKQCTETTVKGKQCMNKATKGEYCTLHDKSRPRCAGITTKGVQCKRTVAKQGDKCHQHAFQQPAANQ